MSTVADDPENLNIPFGYLITFRCYGTWLRGDSRGSVDRVNNRYGTPRISPSAPWREYNENLMLRQPVKLNADRRKVIEAAIRETCEVRQWRLWVMNVRTNHIHVVVSAACKPEVVLVALKANATRQLRFAGLWRSSRGPWVRRGSRKHLCTLRDMVNAIAYVEDDQGEPLA
jgi:REP element-mobilizing transposase RayT